MKKQENKLRPPVSAKEDQKDIQSFEGQYSFLSNDFPTWVYFQGLLYPSVTTAFQAARTTDQSIRKQIVNITSVKQFSQICLKIKNPQNWKDKKYQIMELLVRDKFKRNKELSSKLMGTKNRKLLNGLKNQGFNEMYWGMVKNRGNNMLGKIIMDIRRQIHNGVDTKMWIKSSLNIEPHEKMWPIASILVSKDGKKVDKLFFEKKNYFILGSTKNIDFALENPTISRFHACIYFSTEVEMMIVDLNSTHGSFITKNGKKNQLESLIPYSLEVGDILHFGTSAREYSIDTINRQQVEKHIAQTQTKLEKQLLQAQQSNKMLQNSDHLKKQDIKHALGITYPCLLVQNLQSEMSYHKIRQRFQKYGKVKKVKTKIDQKNGKFLGIAVVYFQENKASLAACKQEEKYKIRIIAEDEAEKIVNGRRENERRSRSSEKQRSHKRSRSRQKKQKR